jgi:hypothetical protein
MFYNQILGTTLGGKFKLRLLLLLLIIIIIIINLCIYLFKLQMGFYPMAVYYSKTQHV